MLISARPRFVLNSFETFDQFQRVESLHRLLNMTNNDANAWNIFRPVAPSVNNGWNQNLTEFSNESLPYHNLYAGYFQPRHPLPQDQLIRLPSTSSYAPGSQNQYQDPKEDTARQRMYQAPKIEINYSESPGPMLTSGYSQWTPGARHASFAEFSSTRGKIKDTTYQTPTDTDLTPFASTLSLAPQPYHEDCFKMGVYDIYRASPNTIDGSYSSSNASTNPLSNGSHQILDPYDGATEGKWCAENLRCSPEQHQSNHGLPIIAQHMTSPQIQNNQELPLATEYLAKFQSQQHQTQQYCNLWNTQCKYSDTWTTKPNSPITISPKVLTLDVPAAPLSSSGSSQGIVIPLSDSSSCHSSGDDTPAESGPETFLVVEPQLPARRPRQILPDSLQAARNPIHIVPKKDTSESKTAKKRTMKSKSDVRPRGRATPLTSSAAIIRQETETTSPALLRAKRIEPKSTTEIDRGPCIGSTQPAATVQAMHHRDAKDDFLVRSKLAGMSYKDIRRHGNFTEAESTLRGRFRTLTKHKTARVRKPEWSDNDIRLLRKAVQKHMQDSDPSKSKVPWKQVAEYISNNGGSYLFGNATCRKRWDELQANRT